MTLNTPLKEIYGVGQKYEKYLSSNGLNTVGELLYYFPRAYQNRGDIYKLSDIPSDNMPHSYILTVANEPTVSIIRKGMNILKFRAFDDTGTVNIAYFNQNYLKDIFTTGSQFRFWGKITRDKRTLYINSPAYEPYIHERPLPDFLPVYPLFSGVNQKYISKLQKEIRPYIKAIVKDHLPECIRLKNQLCTIAYALENIHFPEDASSLQTAIKRLTFDEFFLFALSLSKIRTVSDARSAPLMKDSDISDFVSVIPYDFTNAQRRVIQEIAFDMCRKKAVFSPRESSHNEENFDAYCDDSPNSNVTHPEKFTKQMNRIVVGDVGSGKTVCAAAAAYIACKNGYQCALMAPTEILASQHYESLSPIFERLGKKCELLTGALLPKEKKAVLLRLKNGETDFIIGTHALIQTGVEFLNAGLVITDEQHRFGVMQRALLAEKSRCSHVLVMSATPIPRTLSLMIYGDLDISLIDELPPGRKRVDTFVVNESYRSRLNSFIRKQTDNEHQVYIVCPTVEEKQNDIDNASDYNPFETVCDNTKSQLKAAVNYADELKKVFSDLKIEFIHGKMKAKEKDRIMLEFSERKIDILVSTTVIEVGVNIPNATLMIVENADRFGLSQLHQLRGRVGRGDSQSYCILVSDSESPASKQRLEIMHRIYDGYSIAEYDLKMRGPGEFFSNSTSIRQSGAVVFNIAKSCSDTTLLHKAFESAKEILPNISDYPLLSEKADLLCDIKATTIN